MIVGTLIDDEKKVVRHSVVSLKVDPPDPVILLTSHTAVLKVSLSKDSVLHLL